MKVGILTLPLGANYGGILQTVALQETLRGMGHEAVTLDVRFPESKVRAEASAGYAERTAAMRSFLHRHAVMSEPLACPLRSESVSSLGLDGFVVGSDQVWRPSFGLRSFYSAMFLTFLGSGDTRLRVAYGASFGQTRWTVLRRLLYRWHYAGAVRRFDGVSVREPEGQSYCRSLFGLDVPVVLDPVLLHARGLYERFASSEARRSPGVCAYILDATAEKRRAVEAACARFGGDEAVCFGGYCPGGTDVMASPASWLAGFRDARFVVTDSFHGTVLAILFGKPFVSFVNASRGASRFSALLSPLGLSAHAVSPGSGESCWRDVFERRPDEKDVSARLSALRASSVAFLARYFQDFRRMSRSAGKESL